MGERRSKEGRLSTRSASLDHVLAHDIPNYLNIIQGQTDYLLADVDDPDVEERLNAIKRQAIAATAMLQTVGGGTRDGSQAEFDTVNVGDIVANEADRLRSAYPAATIATTVEEGVFAKADPLLTSVIGNLIENAIQHNDSSTPHVEVTVTTREGEAIVAVEDDGPGLPDAVRDKLLRRDLAHPQSGVHIVRFLVDKYGGSLSVESSRDGTKITVELPGGRN